MTTFTLPRELIKEKNLVILPRREYEDLLRLAKKLSYTKFDQDLDEAIVEYRAGKFFGPFESVKDGIKFLEAGQTAKKKR